jgi:hypothetical protein
LPKDEKATSKENHQHEPRNKDPGNYSSIFSDTKGKVLVTLITLVSALCFKFVYENLGQSSLALPVPSEDPLSGFLDSAFFLLHYYLLSALNFLRSSD